MVLTNYELWAADGSSGSSLPLDLESNNPHTRHLNPFDPRVIPQLNSNLNHLSSNGYYGFSYVNAAHDTELNNNNNNNIVSVNQNNNNSTTYNLMGNDVNGMNNTFTTSTTAQQTHASSVSFGSTVSHAANVSRCKKRSFITNDDNVASDCIAADNKNYYSNSCEISAKRCRFDDDFSAEYCNDFFQLPSTQIATQSCLMDTEDGMPQQYHQQQVDEALFENNNNDIEKFEHKLNPQLQNLSDHQHQQQSHQQLQSQQQQQQHEPQQQHLYHQQQHYQDILFATNKCHFHHNNNCDTFALNNHTCNFFLEKNTENVLKSHNPNSNNSIQSENDKYENDVANDFKVDDAILFAQLHGGCLHHHFNRTICFSEDYIGKNDAMNKHLPEDNFYEEF